MRLVLFSSPLLISQFLEPLFISKVGSSAASLSAGTSAIGLVTPPYFSEAGASAHSRFTFISTV